MEELKKLYAEKQAAFEEKYKDIIFEIAEKNKVDLGVGMDMLKAVARGNEDYAQGIEIDLETLKEDCEELRIISKLIAEGV